MNNEILEIFNDNFETLGHSTYDEVHVNGFWHQVIHCWLIDISTNFIIYQKRSKNKSIYPNMLDVSVAGHCRINENPEQTVAREAFEELGISIEINKLFKVGIRRDSFTIGEMTNREFQYIYFYKLDVLESNIRIQKEELQYVVLIKLENILKSITETILISAEKYSEGIYSKINISPSEFIPSIDNYNIKIPIAISSYLKTNSKIYF